MATTRKVAVMDHGMGNLRSVAKALEAAGASVEVTSDRAALRRSDALCVPGQGIFGRCMDTITASGLGDEIKGWIGEGRPFLGICLGMQVLFGSSEESGGVDGLGIYGGEVRKLRAGKVRVPHIGWNTSGEGYMYFDHSYAVHPSDEAMVSGWCEHGERFAAQIEKDGVLGVQFHPEKSGKDGIGLLRKWVNR